MPLTVFIRKDPAAGGVHRVSSDSTLRQLIETVDGRIPPDEPDDPVIITWPASRRESPRTTISDSATSDPRLNVNTAGAAELRRLPGIGEVKARRILRYRAHHGPFRNPSELMRVRGMGKATLEKLAPLIRF